MGHLSRRICWISAATGVVIISGLCPAQQAVKPSSDAEFAHYRQWTKVNAKPVLFQAAAATQCAAPQPSQEATIHRDKFITVYVNPIAKSAMLHDSNPIFPEGAVIIKEKCATATGKTPELMTVMRKQAKGYDPKNGDWEYLVLDGATGKVREQGHLTNCQECHREKASTDYLFRTPYLSITQQVRLKPASHRTTASN